MSEMAVIGKFECPSCGNIIKREQALQPVSGGYKFASPTGCGCGRKGGFRLTSFQSASTIIVPENKAALIIPVEREEELGILVQDKLNEGKQA